LVGVDAVADVRLVGAEERLERERGELPGRVGVLAAERVDVVAPVVGDECADGHRLLHALAIALDVTGQDRRRERRGREHADSGPRRQVVAVGLRARQVQAGMRLLEGLRQDAPRRHLPEFSVPGELVRLPDLRQHRERLLPHRPCLARVDSLPELLVGIRAAGPELEPAVRQLVQHGGALCHVDRVVRGQDRHAEADSDPARELAERAEQHLRARRAGEPGQKVVLHEPEVVESHPVGEDALLERLLVERVPLDARALERSLRLVEQAESHGVVLLQRWRIRGGRNPAPRRPTDRGRSLTRPAREPTMSHGRAPRGPDVNPDVVAAIARLETEHVLSAGQAALFERVARRRLVSVRFEIRTLLYVGILLVTSGVGIVVAEHHRDIGALATAAAIAVATVACLSWVARHDAPFSWGEVESPHAAFDYVLLLGLMLFATELAYVETQFTVLGPRWPHH